MTTHDSQAVAVQLSPERKRIAKILKRHIQQAFEELSLGYDVTLKSKYDEKSVRIQVIVKGEIP